MNNTIMIVLFGLNLFNFAEAQVCGQKVVVDENQKALNKIAEFQYADFKKCYADLAKYDDVTVTSIPGVTGSAFPLLCSGPKFKLSNAFTKEQLDAGVPVLADTKNVYVYLTDTGFKYAEFPVFYRIVKYDNGKAGYDIGMLPKNFMPIQSSDGKFRVVTGDGEVITFDNPKVKPIDVRINYSDNYTKLFPEHSLSAVTIKESSKEVTDEKAHQCLLENAKTLLNRVSIRKMDFIYSFQFARDEKNATIFKDSDPAKLLALKEKYKRSNEEMVSYYIETLKSLIPACSNTFSDEDYKKQADRALNREFMIDYESNKQHINYLSSKLPK